MTLRIKTLFTSLALAVTLAASPSLAVNPDEVLDNPVLEERARAISADLRCVVCRGENIDESNAEIARDLRLLVRERLVEGDSNEDVIDFIVERYGEYVLMKPTILGANIVLWLAGPVLFLLAGVTGVLYLRRRSRSPDQGQGLSDTEQARLDELMKD